MQNVHHTLTACIGCIVISFGLQAQTTDQIFQAVGTPANPKVEILWNRYYTAEGHAAIAQRLAEAHPDLVRVSSIGKSYENRDLWCLTVTDFRTGDPDEKPGFYIDGNIHSNEIQGTEYASYTAWFLAESFESNDFINNLLKEKVFYIVPSINPDARNAYMQGENTANTPRSGMMPVDDDRDGLFDEDGYDDVNGDGHITQMRRKTKFGQWKVDPEHPQLMVRVDDDEFGDYEMLGSEGIDNDGDGRVNEDRVGGYYDPNRDWGWGWQPGHIQGGAYKYPFSVPENRAVAEFVMAHPNIAGAQSYHNTGGMILRGPGASEDQQYYDRTDDRVYDHLGRLGEQLLPGYRYMVVHRDLYTAFGGELDWFHGGRGIYTFTNELYTSYLMMHRNYRQGEGNSSEDTRVFGKHLLFDDHIVPWQAYDHPLYGEIEIGGTKRNYRRANPGFQLESDAHRNMAFTLYHAYQTPKLVIDTVEEKSLPGGLTEITVTVANQRIIPTHSSQDLRFKINPPDYVILEGRQVITGLRVTDRDRNLTKEQKFEPHQVEIPNIPGMGTATARWIVRGNGPYSITVRSQKGGVARWNSAN